MPSRIEDYALIGDCHTAALVGRDGSIDWLCFPRFGSGACFSALLGTADHGRWLLAPAVPAKAVRRHYREGTLVLETEFETESGRASIIDCMPPCDASIDLLRVVEGVRSQVPMRLELVIRFDYGSIVPWVQRHEQGITAIAGPDIVLFRSGVPLRGEDSRTLAEFPVSEREQVKFALTWYPSNERAPRETDIDATVADAERLWRSWSERCTYDGPWGEAVLRSLITIKAMTYAPTGGIDAAPTTSLPERIGGIRNWDYRLRWLRDATFALYALMNAGYLDEARAWREWLLRAVAGRPEQMQIMYGLAGEHRLTEMELPWLPGYEGSKPVRTGNAASAQFHLDVYGEVMDVLHQGRCEGLDRSEASWHVQSALLDFLESHWKEPDEGIWEGRGGRRHFTHSKVMAWVAFDRAVKRAEQFGRQGPVDRWRDLRDAIHREVCERGFHPRSAPSRGLRVEAPGRKPAPCPLGRFPAGDRPARPGHDRRDRARLESRWLHPALSTGIRGGRPASRRRCLPQSSRRPWNVRPCPCPGSATSGFTSHSHNSIRPAGRLFIVRAAGIRVTPSSAATTTHAAFLNVCSPCAMTSAYSPRSTTPSIGACWETSLRHSRISASSTRPSTSNAIARDPQHNAAVKPDPHTQSDSVGRVPCP
jgi:GH15 family glucan-1,4-alpha-glucosidase